MDLSNLKSYLKSFLKLYYLEIIFLCCCIFLYYGPTSYSLDGYYYFAQLISLFEDGDLEIYNNLENFPYDIPIRINEWSFGPAVFWTPFYLLGRLLYPLINLLFPSIPEIYTEEVVKFRLNVGFINIGSLFYVYIGLKLLSKTIERCFNEKYTSKICLISSFFCTPLIYYTFRLPLMAHTISFFLASVLIYFWQRWHDVLNTKQILAFSFIIGLTTLVRLQNVIFAIVLIPQIKSTIVAWKKDLNTIDFINKLLFHILISALIFSLTFSPQLIAWWFQFGNPVPIAYSISDFSFFNPNFNEVWFGVHGLFIWHPIFILFTLGFLAFLIRKDLNTIDGIVLFLCFLIQCYIWAIWRCPEAGCSFGMRGIIDSFPMIIFGFAGLISVSNNKYHKATVITISLLVVVFTLMNLYLFAFLGHPYGDVTLRCGTYMNYEWYFNINWEILGNTFVPRFPPYKIVMIFWLGFFLILANSLYIYYRFKQQ